MKHTNPLLLLSALLLILSPLSADTVDTNDVVTFTAGDPACAADVNQTIQALIDAVDGNAAQIAALELRIAELESPTLLSIISDSTFTIYSMETALGQEPRDNPVVAFSATVSHSLFGEVVGSLNSIKAMEEDQLAIA